MKRHDIGKMLKDPEKRKWLFVRAIQAMAELEGRSVSLEYCEEIYEKLKSEEDII